MTEEGEINVFACLDYIRDNASVMAKSKAVRVYMEEYRKSLKAILMQKAQMDGATSSATQEREAYADPEYTAHLQALSTAVEAEEYSRWMLVAAQVKIDAWRSIESSRRIEAKSI